MVHNEKRHIAAFNAYIVRFYAGGTDLANPLPAELAGLAESFCPLVDSIATTLRMPAASTYGDAVRVLQAELALCDFVLTGMVAGARAVPSFGVDLSRRTSLLPATVAVGLGMQRGHVREALTRLDRMTKAVFADVVPDLLAARAYTDAELSFATWAAQDLQTARALPSVADVLVEDGTPMPAATALSLRLHTGATFAEGVERVATAIVELRDGATLAQAIEAVASR